MPDPRFSPEMLRRVAQQALAENPEMMSYDQAPAAAPAPAPPGHGGMHAALAAMGIGQGLDAMSTIQALHSGTAQEANPILGSNPSAARVIATKAPMAFLAWLLDQKVHDQHPKVAKALALAAGGAGAAAAAHNYGVMRKAQR